MADNFKSLQITRQFAGALGLVDIGRGDQIRRRADPGQQVPAARRRARQHKGRARSAETFSIYNSLSYGLRKKGRAQRGKFLKLDIVFLKLA